MALSYLAPSLVSIAAVILSAIACADAKPPTTDIGNKVEPLFTVLGTQGTFVAHAIESNQWYISHPARAETGYPPASTFQLLNSLIALDKGIVDNVYNDPIVPHESPYLVDGQAVLAEECSSPQSLSVALPLSCVPIFQTLAQEIGEQGYREAFERIGYGNGDLSAGIDRFWLQGDFRVTAKAQAELMTGIATRDYPFESHAYDQLKAIALLESGNGYALYGKTGRALEEHPVIGWFVGWLERPQGDIAFALNLEVNEQKHSAARVAIAKQVFEAMGWADFKEAF